MRMEDNFWVAEGTDEVDIECPPGGHLIDGRYPNGDQLIVRFRENETAEVLDKRYPGEPSVSLIKHGGAFPITTVEITLRLPELDIDFGPTRASFANDVMVERQWSLENAIGVLIGDETQPLRKPKPPPPPPRRATPRTKSKRGEARRKRRR
jgi:hypothetical protein